MEHKFYLCVPFGKFFVMNGLKSYSIPFKSAVLGEHEYLFSVDKEFFAHFEVSDIENGNFDIKVVMDRKANMLDLEFYINGTFLAPCDRCLSEIGIEIEDVKRIVVKFDDLGREDTDEVMYIGTEESNLYVGDLIYEFIALSMPISNTIDCEGNNYQYCDEDVLKKFEELEEQAEQTENKLKEEKLQVWDQLKDIKLN